jgi:hypothetical protein
VEADAVEAEVEAAAAWKLAASSIIFLWAATFFGFTNIF